MTGETLTEAQRRAYRDAVDAVNRATDRQIAEAEHKRQQERTSYAPAFRAALARKEG